MTSAQFQTQDNGGGPNYGPSGLSYAAPAAGYDAGLLPSSRVAGSGDLYSGLYIAPSLMPGRPSNVINDAPPPVLPDNTTAIALALAVAAVLLVVALA